MIFIFFFIPGIDITVTKSGVFRIIKRGFIQIQNRIVLDYNGGLSFFDAISTRESV
ncbi:MAG: hypothetical protein JXB88_20705 [Spirochaetales bacterium]|nr:hypothetical protein [Spirochaetales bacterium]